MITVASGHYFSMIYRSHSKTNLRWKVSCRSEMAGLQKSVWLWTKSKDVMTTSVERGWETFIFTPETESLVKEWKSVAKIRPYFLRNGELLDEEKKEVAAFGEVSCAKDLESLKSLAEKNDIVVMDAKEWQIISAENMIAFFQKRQALFFAISRTASEAQLFFESLEKGTDGIVLKTEDTNEVILLKDYVTSNAQKKMKLSPAVVRRVELMGMGDRVCVDLCSLLIPGEGLLVGSFARGLFLVHSECLQSNYVASRPFRVNAGPVHAYVALPGGRTSYLAELKSGMEVLVVDAYGRQRGSTVGRVKIESRPLILVEAVGEDEPTTYSLLLQNAETVNLVCPLPVGYLEIELKPI